MRRRGGFTLVELIIVTAVMGILVRIALPKLQNIRQRALATRIFSDLRTIRDASYHYYTDAAIWPANGSTGTVPSVLKTYLPVPLQNWKPDPTFSYTWMLSGMPGGDPTRATSGALMGVGVNTSDATLRAAVMAALSGAPSYKSGNTVYLLIWGPGLRP